MIVLAALLAAGDAVAEPLRVGSKRFTESYILAEIAAQTARAAGADARHVEGLGATAIAFKALEDGAIDLYPDYTGTIADTLFHGEEMPSLERLRAVLQERGLDLLGPLGFENTYALAVRPDFAQKKAVATVSNLARVPDPFRSGISHEFLGRTGRLARPLGALRNPPARRARDGPRARVRRAHERVGRRGGRILDRRQDRSVRPAVARRRSALLSVLRR